MANAWMTHLQSVRKSSPGMSLKDAMKKAKKTYKKLEHALPLGVHKTKKHRKHRKHSKHPHKGKKSRTRKGRLDFVTHKGDKDFNKGNKRQRKSRKPYRKGRKGGNQIVDAAKRGVGTLKRGMGRCISQTPSKEKTPRSKSFINSI